VAEIRECQDKLENFVEFSRAKVKLHPRQLSSSAYVCQEAFGVNEVFPIVAAAADERLVIAPVSAAVTAADCERRFRGQNIRYLLQ
jgi:hypothetical protein